MQEIDFLSILLQEFMTLLTPLFEVKNQQIIQFLVGIAISKAEYPKRSFWAGLWEFKELLLPDQGIFNVKSVTANKYS